MMMIIASVLLQIICAVHCVRSGRSQMWILIIVFFSVLGCLAYFVMEVLPGYGGNRWFRAARAGAKQRLDPKGDLRRAEAQLDIADTVANRLAVADALAAMGDHAGAAKAYRDALSRTHGNDPRTRFKLAQALFESHEDAQALAELDALPETFGTELERRDYLRARILAHMGQSAEARRLFEGIIDRIPGDAARCHYAAFLLEQGDRWRAITVLEDVEKRAKRLDRLQRAQEGPMYKWAADQLKALRAG